MRSRCRSCWGPGASDAQRALREAGLTATIDTGTPDGIVYGQTPLPGRMVARGSEVEIDALGLTGASTTL